MGIYRRRGNVECRNNVYFEVINLVNLVNFGIAQSDTLY